MKFDKEKAIRMNKQDREWFIDYWAEYIRKHSDKEWSRQQAVLINSQLRNARKSMTKEAYMNIKCE